MKKVITFFVMAFFMACGNSPAQASDTIATVKSPSSSIQVIKPSNDYFITTNDKVVISGKGKEGTTVELEVYAKKDGKLYTLTQKKSFGIGPIGLFCSEINLLDGENKVLVKSGEESIEKIVKYIRVNDVQKNIDEINEKGIKGLVK